MSAATDATTAAEKLIEAARAKGSDRLNLDVKQCRALTRLPDSIAQLTNLKTLDLGNTQVTDLTPIAQMTAMTMLTLSNTQVTDLSPIAQMTGMRSLYFGNLQIEDLTPLAEMSRLEVLSLWRNPAANLDPLVRVTQLTKLDLDNTKITDLRPVRGMKKLRDEPFSDGLTFKNTPATKSDPRLAEIAEIEDNKDRATQLFDYLDWLDPPAGYAPDKAEKPTPPVPEKTPAPLETTIQGNTLSRVPPQRNADNDATTEERAKQGWEELRDYRDSFGSSFNVSNYAPLPAILKSFDRALGGSYDSMRQIGVGMHGQRIILLSRDPGFLENLPTGGASELAGLAAAVDTFVNRFPDWISYQEDAEATPPTAKDVTDIRPAFEGLGDALKASRNVDAEVSEEFCDEVFAVKDDPESEIEAKGLLASTRNVAVTLSETALADVKSGRSTKSFVQKAQKTGETELPKIIYYAGPGFAADMLGRMNPSLRNLAQKFPKRMGWVNSVLDYLGYENTNP